MGSFQNSHKRSCLILEAVATFTIVNVSVLVELWLIKLTCLIFYLYSRWDILLMYTPTRLLACVKLFSIFTLLICPLCMNKLNRADRTGFKDYVSLSERKNFLWEGLYYLIVTFKLWYWWLCIVLDFKMDFMVLSVFSSHEANYNLIFNSKVLSDRIKEWIKGPTDNPI